MTKLELFLTLVIVYQVKHLVADYFLQGKYMLGKFKGGWDWVLPLLAHVGVHASFTYVIALVVGGSLDLALLLALFDASVHFVMDRIKASPQLMGRWKALSGAEYVKAAAEATREPLVGLGFGYIDVLHENAKRALRNNVYFWRALGFDQFIHHLTHYAIVWVLVSR